LVIYSHGAQTLKRAPFEIKWGLLVIETVLTRLFRLKRWQKLVIQLVADAVLIVASFAIAMALRLESFRFVSNPRVWHAIAIALPVCLAVFAQLGFYRAVVRYMSRRSLDAILIGIFASSAVLFIGAQVFGLPVPRSVPAIYAALATGSIGGARFLVQLLFFGNQMKKKAGVIIYGAGESGRQLLSAIRHSPEYAPVAFVDDSETLQGTEIGGFYVYAPDALERLVKKTGARIVLLAVPSASRAARKAILERLEPLPVHVQTIPGIADIVSGKASINEFREVSIEDLLGRDPVPPRSDLMDANIRGKAVLVTGAGGSIGSELCRQIIRNGPTRLVIFELSELALYTIDLELKAAVEREGLNVEIVPVLGSVQDPRRVESILNHFAIETVYHAAAYKHVPLVEENVIEGVRNNIFGTLNMVTAAMTADVKDFILISTDKAVRPTNVMGASKRVAELICQAHTHRGRTRFSMVRFGNVLGSSGSVIPRFRAQIQSGGPVTVTHPEITRYFMTIQEAAQLVIQAGAMARGGDVFVLDMGEPVRIVDLAKRMIRLSGLTPYLQDSDEPRGDIAITFTGLRHGEKLYEELLIGAETTVTSHPRILTAQEQSMSWVELQKLLVRLRTACEAQDIETIRKLLENAPTGYHPAEKIVDLVWGGETAADTKTMAGKDELPRLASTA